MKKILFAFLLCIISKVSIPQMQILGILTEEPPPDVVLLNTVTMSAAANISINLSTYVGSYSTIRLRIKNYKANAGDDELWMRVSNTTDFDPGANAYVYGYTTSTGISENNFADKIKIAWHMDENADASSNGDISIFSPSVTTQRPQVGWVFYIGADNNGTRTVVGNAWYGANQATNYVQLLAYTSGAASTTTASCTIQIWGEK